MKKRAIVLSAVMLLSITLTAGLTACKLNTKKPDGGFKHDYTDTVEATDPEAHYVSTEKTLHRVTVTPSQRAFVTNGTTDYVIVVGTARNEARAAANFISTQLAKVAGVQISTVYDTDGDKLVDSDGMPLAYNASAKYIVFSHAGLEEEAGVVWASEVNLGYSGYMIKSVGNSVFVKVNSAYGYQTAARCFLRHVLGYEWYSDDMIVYTKDGSTLPDMDIVEKPDFDFIDRSFISGVDKYPTAQTNNPVFAYLQTASGNAFVHNALLYLPKSEHQAQYPEWYADGDQLCYTAHGNKQAYDAMVDAALAAVLDCLNKNPLASTVTFTQMDNSNVCNCETCLAAETAFSTLSSTMVMFCNDLDTKLQAALEAQAQTDGTEKREIMLLFFSYVGMEEAPVTGSAEEGWALVKNPDNRIEKNGNTYELPFQQTYPDGIKCNDHVGLFYAPIRANYTQSFYHKENQVFAERLQKWSLLTDCVYAWIYDTNFIHYMLPYNSYDSIGETLRFLKDHNVMYVFNQAQGTSHGNTNSVITGFGALKTYLNFTLSLDVNQNEKQLTDKFFDNYFGAAAPVMREYYDSLALYMRRLEAEYPTVFNGSVNPGTNNAIESAQYWPLAMLQGWLDKCDKAYAAIERYEQSDPELYELLYNHITVETIFPRFMICEYYTGYFTNEEVLNMRRAFIADCALVGIQAHNENKSLKEVCFDGWNVG